MGASYYITKNLQDRYEFKSIDSLVNFLYVSGQNKGEIFVSNFSKIKIEFNVHTGHVNPVSSVEMKGVINIFSQNAFQSILKPVSDAICVVAKLSLLQQLVELNDEKITDIVFKHRVVKAGTIMNVTQGNVDKALREIRNCLKPRTFFGGQLFKSNEMTDVQKAVYDVLNKYNKNKIDINSKTVVEKMMGEINNQLKKDVSETERKENTRAHHK